MSRGKISIILFILMSFMVLSSCSKDSATEVEEKFIIHEPKEFEEIEPILIETITNDSFSMLFSGDYLGDYLAVLDVVSCKCFVYENYQLKTVFGSKGEGPGEFNFMNMGVIKFTPDSNIVIYNPMNTRIQYFSLDGELLKSVQSGYFGMDFDIFGDYIVLTSMMGNDELIFIDPETGEEYKKYQGEKNINIMEEQLPPPFRVFEIVHDSIILFLTVDDYMIYRYTLEDSIISGFGVKWETLLFSDEDKEMMLERVGNFREMYEDRIREEQFPCWVMLYDKITDRLWINIASEASDVATFDIFNGDGIYLKRIKYLSSKDFMTLVINNGIMAGFDGETAELQIYDMGVDF